MPKDCDESEPITSQRKRKKSTLESAEEPNQGPKQKVQVMENAEESFQLYVAEETNGERHTLLRAPRALPSEFLPEGTSSFTDALNVLMADASGSMSWIWSDLISAWNEHIVNSVTGDSKTYVFTADVDLRREGTLELTEEDFACGGTESITNAVRAIRKEIEKSSRSYVRVFMITDGGSAAAEPHLEEELKKAVPPLGKTVEVYLLGIGCGFPVNISIDIRSCMHNGSANLPSMFWAKEHEDLVEQISSIAAELSGGLVPLEINHKGYILPGLDTATNMIHLNEWIYFTEPPESLISWTLKVGDEEPKALNVKCQEVSTKLLLDYVFRQWNSVLLQEHRKKKPVPHEVFDLMESLFNQTYEEVKKELIDDKDVKSRLLNKRIKSIALEYSTLMNQCKTIIGIEGKYMNELELAETILKSTVTNRKYDVKNLKMKGHSLDDYETDLKAFKELYLKSKQAIQDLPTPTPDDCCRITITSTLQDLQDPNFSMILEENKFDFLKTFTMTGIPVYAPVRDSSQINPWTFAIKHILVTPFTILSQQVLEAYADADSEKLGDANKDAILQKDNEKTRFNAIIPIVSEDAANTLKPLVRSNIYAMSATFCILKNPHIIDHNAHIAALGCAWTNTLREFPPNCRPEFAQERMKSIVVTANLYVDRSGIARYMNAVISHPKQALMTESMEEFDGQTLKCESLVKPLFFIHLIKGKLTAEQKISLLRLSLAEFVGRCLANYKLGDPNGTPFIDFFAVELNDPERKKNSAEKHTQNISEGFLSTHENLLEAFYSMDDLLFAIKKYAFREVIALAVSMVESVSVDMEKVKKLKNFGSCGDVTWATFKPWAQEMEIPDEEIEAALSSAEMLIHVNEALQNRNSRDRLSKEPQSEKEATEFVKQKVIQESIRILKAPLLKEVEKLIVNKWRQDYSEAHSSLVMPLSREHIVQAAQVKGVSVTAETFEKVYRYNDQLKMLRNACQIPSCPHYLVPHNNFNQHLSIEREKENFPHSLHLVSHEFVDEGIEGVIKRVTTGTNTGTNGRRQPSIPEPSSVDYLRDQLENLLDEYRSSEVKTTVGSGDPAKEEEDMEEEFYDCPSG